MSRNFKHRPTCIKYSRSKCNYKYKYLRLKYKYIHQY